MINVGAAYNRVHSTFRKLWYVQIDENFKNHQFNLSPRKILS